MGKLDEYLERAKDQSAAMTLGAREKVQGVLQDAGAVKEIAKGIEELEALPEFEGSILYNMELQTMLSDLRSLQLIVKDNRLDDDSVEEEIREVMEKVKPAAAQAGAIEAAETQAEGTGAAETAEPITEDQAINNAKMIAYNACVRALEAMGIA